MPLAEFGTAQFIIVLQNIVDLYEESTVSPVKWIAEYQASLHYVAEIVILHLIIDQGDAVVFVPLLSKLVENHEFRLNKKIVTNSLNSMTLSELGSYLSV